LNIIETDRDSGIHPVGGEKSRLGEVDGDGMVVAVLMMDTAVIVDRNMAAWIKTDYTIAHLSVE